MSKQNTGVPVTLAGRDFVVKRIPMARIKIVGATLSTVFKEFSNADVADQDVATAFLNKILEFPYEILKLFIKDLPKEIFEDEENGVSFPEFLEALEIAGELNRYDALKNLFTRLSPMIQANISRLTN